MKLSLALVFLVVSCCLRSGFARSWNNFAAGSVTGSRTTGAPATPTKGGPTTAPTAGTTKNTPSTEAPSTAAPTAGTTKNTPSTEAPSTAAPTTGTTKNTPSTEAPSTAAPTTGTTKNTPSTEAPSTAAPTAGTTENNPTTQAPTTGAPSQGSTKNNPSTEAPSTATPTPAPGYGSYFGYNNTKYFFSCGKGEDWMSAWMGCRSFKYNLVKIGDEYHNEALRAIASFGAGPSCTCGTAHVWIGLVYEAESDRYVWEGDESIPASYENWATGQPGNHTEGVNCVYMDYNDGKWYKEKCDHMDFNFLCQGATL